MDTPSNWFELSAEERLNLKLQMDRDDEKRVELTLPDVVVPGHDVEADALPKQPREIYSLLESKGRKVRTVHSATLTRGTVFKSGKRVGEFRPDKLIDHYGLGTTDGRFPVVYAFWMEPASMLFAKVAWSPDDMVEVRLVTTLKKSLEEYYGQMAIEGAQ